MFGGGDSNLVRILIFSLTSAGSTSHRVASSAVKQLFGEVEQSQSWLKVATTAFTFKTLSRHYAKRELTPRSLNVKLGPRRKGHKGRAVWLA